LQLRIELSFPNDTLLVAKLSGEKLIRTPFFYHSKIIIFLLKTKKKCYAFNENSLVFSKQVAQLNYDHILRREKKKHA
jgi:hypothetical protein